MSCEDFPCCGHERGCCPDYDRNGNQLNMICLCGAELPLNSPSSICRTCLRSPDWDDRFDGLDNDDEDDDWIDF